MQWRYLTPIQSAQHVDIQGHQPCVTAAEMLHHFHLRVKACGKVGGCQRHWPLRHLSCISTSLIWDNRWRWRATSWMARASAPTPARRSASRWDSPEPCNPACGPSCQDHNELCNWPWLICKLAACHVCLCRYSAWGCQQERGIKAAAVAAHRALLRCASSGH